MIAAALMAVTLLAVGGFVAKSNDEKHDSMMSTISQEAAIDGNALATKDNIQQSLRSILADELKVTQGVSRLDGMLDRSRFSLAGRNVQQHSSAMRVDPAASQRNKLEQLHREALQIVAKSKAMASRGKSMLEQLEDIPDDMLEVLLLGSIICTRHPRLLPSSTLN
jgi:hypothetical protein